MTNVDIKYIVAWVQNSDKAKEAISLHSLLKLLIQMAKKLSTLSGDVNE